MKITRIVAGSVVALLLAVTSVAAACDLSCAFALGDSDCHSGESASQSSTDLRMAMDGMDMAGMAMPGMAYADEQASKPEVSPARAGHPSIGDMGPCERQSCDKSSFVSVKASRAGVAPLHSILVFAEIAFAGAAPELIRGARDDVAFNRPLGESPLLLSLRI
jgi:hypothetical protein